MSHPVLRPSERRHRAPYLLLAAMLVLGVLVVGPSRALAAQGHVFEPPPIGEGVLNNPIGIAFDEASGDLYVADANHGRVDKFDPATGQLDTSFGAPNGFVEGFNTPWGVAVDQMSHDVYVAQQGAFAVSRLDENGEPEPFTCTVGPNCSVSGNRITGTGSGGFDPTGVAVDPADGNLYVADLEHSQVDIFKPSGEFVSSFPTASAGSPFGLAIDSAGNVYVAGAGNDVQRFSSAGLPGPVIEESEVHGAGTVLGVGVDTSTNDVYVAEVGQVAEFDHEGNLLSRFGQGRLANAFQVTVDPATGKVYVTDSEHNAVEPFGPLVGEQALKVVPTGAGGGQIVSSPAGVECGSTCEAGFFEGQRVVLTATPNESSAMAGWSGCTELTPTECELTVGGSAAEVHVAFSAIAQEQLTLKATGTGTGTVISTPKGIQCSGECAHSFNQGTQVILRDSPGVTSTFVGWSGCEGEPEGGCEVTLQAATTVTAEFSAGPACSNEHLREESNLNPITERPYSTELPDCRAYEQVTPSYKGLSLNGGHQRFAADGSAFFATAVASYAGAPGSESTGGTSYEFSRTSEGWQTNPLDPSLGSYHRTPVVPLAAFTTDFGTSLLSLRPLDSALFEGAIYLRAAGGRLAEVGPAAPPRPRGLPTIEPGNGHIEGNALIEAKGASSDLSHVVYDDYNGERLEGELIPWHPLWKGDDTATGFYSLYEYVGTGNAEPSLVGVRNQEALHGTPHLNEGADLISQCGTELGGPRNQHVSDAISADGETIFFTAESPSGHQTCAGEHPSVDELYARVGGSMTLAISEPEGLGSAPDSGCTAAGCMEDINLEADFRGANFEGAAVDGSRVFFTSPQRLLDGATQDPDPEDSAAESGGCRRTSGFGGCNLYEYNLNRPTGERLALLSAGSSSGEGPQVQGVGAISEDGSHVYFVARGVLTEDSNRSGARAVAGSDNLYVYDTGTQGVSFIATLSPQDAEQWGQSGVDDMQATPDGRYLLFTSHADLTPDDTTEASQLFRFDSSTGELIRISIGDAGFNHDGNVEAAAVPTHPDGSALGLPNVDPHPSITDDGSVVVFLSRAALTPTAHEGDLNGYEYESGHIYLIYSDPPDAPGSSTMFVDPRGGDIFFQTTASLSPTDNDTTRDLYDARIDGGFPAPTEPSICHGESCQPAQSSSQAAATPLTSSFGAAESKGSSHPTCRKDYVRRKGRCARRSPRKRHRHHGRKSRSPKADGHRVGGAR